MSIELNILEELKIELEFIQKALNTFHHSYEKCSVIGIKEEYTFDELDKWEVFTSRYGRISDIITQKIIGSIMILTDGFDGSLIDKAHFAEQQGLIPLADDFIKLRLFRNYITHEYNKQNTNEVFEKVLEKYSILVQLAENVAQHCQVKIFSKLT